MQTHTLLPVESVSSNADSFVTGYFISSHLLGAVFVVKVQFSNSFLF